MQLHLIDQTILFVYFIVNIIIGLYFAFEKRQTAEDFIGARNSMSGWVLGLSMVVTYVSSIGFIAYPAKAFSSDWSAHMYNGAIFLIAFLAIRYFIPFHRKNGDISSFTHLGQRFGPWATVYALFCHSVAITIWMGIMLFTIAKTLSFVTGWNEMHIIYIVGIITTFYTCTGGIKSVIWTDALQFVILLFGAVLILFYLIGNTPDGVAGFYNVAMEHNKFSLGEFSFDLTKPNFWTMILSGFALNLYTFAISPPFVQRYVAARSPKEAKSAMLWSTGCFVLITTLLFAIGTALFVYYQTNPGLLPEGMDPTDGDSVYPHFIATALPTGLKGIIIAAMLAAAMSSIDSTVNSLAMLYLVNIHHPFINAQPGRTGSMRILYTVSLLSGFIAIGLALLFRNQKSILDTWYSMNSIFSGVALGLFLLGLMAKKAKKPAAIAGALCGISILVWKIVSPKLTGDWSSFAIPFHEFMTFFFANLVVLLIGLTWTKFRQRALN